ncbi:ArsC family (seleno)protein [Fimbriiglobus ruber]|uniref:Glutaredoxin domain-containing protein n=1 Tax=Fimbriiglobus ruber TaxID=1908690 RepID=A0A225D4V0_9BACT|nr:ArsC family (seleno)protein [Fimbriiglobus ruber]OWK36522.1 hypothetical protein FRUB_09085 [Fimbriiglobus ruber]
MSKPIDWLYFRKSCTTCKKAKGFLEQEGAADAKETVDANKTKIGPAAALALLAGVTKVVAAKGKKVEVFDLKGGIPDEAALLARIIGPTGNLRAPTARVGKTMVVGFNEEAYQQEGLV